MKMLFLYVDHRSDSRPARAVLDREVRRHRACRDAGSADSGPHNYRGESSGRDRPNSSVKDDRTIYSMDRAWHRARRPRPSRPRRRAAPTRDRIGRADDEHCPALAARAPCHHQGHHRPRPGRSRRRVVEHSNARHLTACQHAANRKQHVAAR